jgi:hypothetical protein
VGAPIGAELNADRIAAPGGSFGFSFVRHVALSGAGIVRTASQASLPRHGTRNAVAESSPRGIRCECLLTPGIPRRGIGHSCRTATGVRRRPNASFLPRCGLRTDARQHTVGNSAKPCRAHCLLTRTTQADRHRMGPRPA